MQSDNTNSFSVSDKNKGWLSHNILTKPYNGIHLIVFQCSPSDHLHKGRRSSCCTLVSTAVGTPAAAHAAELDPMAHNGFYPNTHRHTKMFLCLGRFSHSSYQLRRYVTLHCEDWGKAPWTHILGSLGDICINCLLLLPRQSKLHEVVWLRLLENKSAHHEMQTVFLS